MMNADKEAAARAIDAFLRAIGLDPAASPALLGTGKRVADAFVDDLCDGYAVDTKALLAESAIEGHTDLVVMHDIAVTTMCPHHLMPASGTASVAFAPKRTMVGIGAIVRLVDAFAHRLILQEEIGERVVSELMAALEPEWAGCRLSLVHTCMTARGERRHGARVETLSLAPRGALKGKMRAMAERALWNASAHRSGA